MAVLGIQPMILKNVDLLIGDGAPDDFGAHVDSVMFQPTSQTVTWVGGKGNTFTDVTTATWTCQLNYQQDWQSANSLSRYLYTHEGEHLPVKFTPVDGGPEFDVTVIVTPGAIGGAINAYASASVTLGCEGKPEIVEPEA